MTERFIDVSESAAHLRVANGLLVIDACGSTTAFPLEDVAALAVAHPAATYTHRALAGMAQRAVPLLVCDESRLPVGILLPLRANSLQTERIAAQLRVPVPRCNRAWQQLVRAKIRAQAGVLLRLRGEDAGLTGLVDRVQSGDRTNVEAQAARRYWPHLFGDPRFRRNRDADDQNRLLNYGYAVVRAIVARAVCASGLHPSIGLHHHNRNDALCLADDLFEPLRPRVDEVVARSVAERSASGALDPATKQSLIGAIMRPVFVGRESRALSDAAWIMTCSLVRLFGGETKRLEIPELPPWDDDPDRFQGTRSCG